MLHKSKSLKNLDNSRPALIWSFASLESDGLKAEGIEYNGHGWCTDGFFAYRRDYVPELVQEVTKKLIGGFYNAAGLKNKGLTGFYPLDCAVTNYPPLARIINPNVKNSDNKVTLTGLRQDIEGGTGHWVHSDQRQENVIINDIFLLEDKKDLKKYDYFMESKEKPVHIFDGDELIGLVMPVKTELYNRYLRQ